MNIDQVATLYRPDDNYVIESDATYDNYGGLKVRYTSDDETPTQAQLEAISGDFSNINSIKRWWRYSDLLEKDYLSMRKKIAELVVAAGGFANLDDQEKDIACRVFVIEQADQLTLYSFTEIEELGVEYDLAAKAARGARYERGKVHVYNVLEVADAHAVATDFFSLGVGLLYTEGGVLGTLWGDPGLEGILDYINATTGTNYEPNGLRSSGYIPRASGFTIDTLCDDLIGIVMEDLV